MLVVCGVWFSANYLARQYHPRQNAAGLEASFANWDGVWNLGVLEHFETDEQLLILREFHRVLKPGGVLLLWWPPRIAPDQLLLKLFGKSFPDEPGRVTQTQARSRLHHSGFDSSVLHVTCTDAFTELVVVAFPATP